MARSPRSPRTSRNHFAGSRASARSSLLVACMGLALGALTACGSSVVDPSGSGGSTGTGTTTGTGLSSGTGGVSTGGVGGSSTSGGTGGSNTTGGSGGSITTGTGAGGSAPTCPAAEPMGQSACGPVGNVCDYDLTQCICAANGWKCSVCPAAQPVAGDACMNSGPGMGGGAVCGYGDTYCRCSGGGGPGGNTTWKCGMCPAQAPANQSACDVPGVQCPYADPGITCNCGGMGNWNCTQPCPAAEPQPGDACMGGGMGGPQQCTYGNTTCLCVQGQYFCN
jgi:hypothetical protein